MNTVYEYITLTKPRINSKKWNLTNKEYKTIFEPPIQNTKQKTIIYIYENAENIDQVKEFNSTHNLIVMSPLGYNPDIKKLDMLELLNTKTHYICSVTGKKVITAHLK